MRRWLKGGITLDYPHPHCWRPTGNNPGSFYTLFSHPRERAFLPFFSWPRAVKGKQSLAENSASNNLSAVGPSCKESRPPLSLSITPPLTLCSFVQQPCYRFFSSNQSRNFLRLSLNGERISCACADFRAILTEIFFCSKHSEKKFSDERKRTKENPRRFFFLILSNVKSATFENLDRQTTHRFGNCNWHWADVKFTARAVIYEERGEERKGLGKGDGKREG